MAAPDNEQLLSLLERAAQFCGRIGAVNEGVTIEKYHKRFQIEKPTFKVLRGEVNKATDKAIDRIYELLFDECREPFRGKEKLVKEYERIWSALTQVYYPPDPVLLLPEINIAKFEGCSGLKEKKVTYAGKTACVRECVEQSVKVVQDYANAVCKGNFEAAYAFMSEDYQAKNPVQKHTATYRRQNGGYPVRFSIYSIPIVYADADSRKKIKPKATDVWPRNTPKENRRAHVVGFWIYKQDTGGCWGRFATVEESGAYRIGYFGFFTA